MQRRGALRFRAQAAQPVQLHDYVQLAAVKGYRLVGAISPSSGEVREGVRPRAIFHDAAWLVLAPGVPAPESSTGDVETRRATYYSMYMEHQRQQPSYARLRSLVRAGFSLDDTCALYPTTARIVVERMRADVVDTDQLLSHTNRFVADLQRRRLRRKLVGKTSCVGNAVRGKAEADLTQQAQQLAANALSTAADDLARPHAPLESEKTSASAGPRRPDSRT